MMANIPITVSNIICIFNLHSCHSLRDWGVCWSSSQLSIFPSLDNSCYLSAYALVLMGVDKTIFYGPICEPFRGHIHCPLRQINAIQGYIQLGLYNTAIFSDDSHYAKSTRQLSTYGSLLWKFNVTNIISSMEWASVFLPNETGFIS